MAMYYPLVTLSILPVFAGMIHGNVLSFGYAFHSPRIRGDDPDSAAALELGKSFSPYSRG